MHSDYRRDSKEKKKRPQELMEEILSGNLGFANDEQKLKFLLYVVFRYRNNMFHGNKCLSSWLKYKIEINHCIKVMINSIDYLKNKEEGKCLED